MQWSVIYIIGIQEGQIIIFMIWGNSFLFFFKIYFLFERESKRELEQGRDKRRGRERISSRLPSWGGAQHGASISQPWDHDPSGNQESDAWVTEPPRCPEGNSSLKYRTQLAHISHTPEGTGNNPVHWFWSFCQKLPRSFRASEEGPGN